MTKWACRTLDGRGHEVRGFVFGADERLVDDEPQNRDREVLHWRGVPDGMADRFERAAKAVPPAEPEPVIDAPPAFAANMTAPEPESFEKPVPVSLPTQRTGRRSKRSAKP